MANNSPARVYNVYGSHCVTLEKEITVRNYFIHGIITANPENDKDDAEYSIGNYGCSHSGVIIMIIMMMIMTTTHNNNNNSHNNNDDVDATTMKITKIAISLTLQTLVSITIQIS